MRTKDLKGLWNSPFKPPRFRFYFGKIRHGAPIFYPRKWVKLTKIEAIEKALEGIGNPKHVDYKKQLGDVLHKYTGCKTARSIKYFGINLVPLGWKTKFSFLRWEWNPQISIVLFGLQFCIWLIAPKKVDNSAYWESWLYYKYYTDKNQLVKERLQQCFKEAPCTWQTPEGIIDYYDLMLKQRYDKGRSTFKSARKGGIQ